MNFSLKKLTAYCEAHTTPTDQVLYDLERETHLKTLAPQMMSGHLQGQLLQLICQIKAPKQILEIGTFTGFAAICMARGLADGGLLHTIEANKELVYIIEKYIERAKLKDQVQLHVGKAQTIIPELPGPFDIVFIDAGKQHYAFYYDLVFEKVAQGGLIIADNVLWSGKVVQQDHDKDTSIIHAFNEKIHQDPRVTNVMLPVRDGLIIARKL